MPVSAVVSRDGMLAKAGGKEMRAFYVLLFTTTSKRSGDDTRKGGKGQAIDRSPRTLSNSFTTRLCVTVQSQDRVSVLAISCLYSMLVCQINMAGSYPTHRSRWARTRLTKHEWPSWHVSILETWLLTSNHPAASVN
jgi:hypothetical protein